MHPRCQRWSGISSPADICEAVSEDSPPQPPNRTHHRSLGQRSDLPCIDAGLIIHSPWWIKDFAVPCQLIPTEPHHRSGPCSSPCTFPPHFLQTLFRGDALALPRSFASIDTQIADVHPTSSLPCLAHTAPASAAGITASAAGHGSAAVPPTSHRGHASRRLLKVISTSVPVGYGRDANAR